MNYNPDVQCFVLGSYNYVEVTTLDAITMAKFYT